jgi:RHS repeat-associated protein
MSDDSGAKVEGPYVYDPCGNGAPTTGEPYKLTGRRLDPETGLYYYRARYFWPQGCRFLQTDPVGYSADLNLYTYVGNDPVDRTDPTGMANNCGSGNTGSRIEGEDTGHCEGEAEFVGSKGNSKNTGAATNSGSRGSTPPTQHGASGSWTSPGATGSWEEHKPDSGKANDATLDVLSVVLFPIAGPEEAAGKAIIPQVTDRTLENIVRDLYKGAVTSEGRIGTGSTADAVRSELATGNPTRGIFHSEKARQYTRALENWSRRNPSASYRDRLVAESLRMDLQDALSGGGGGW